MILAIAQTTQSAGNRTRCSTYNAYIEPIIGSRSANLHILPYSHVTRILYRENDRPENAPKVSGVQFTQNGNIYQVFANREVIISAGTVNSPKLLQLSGIGPQKLLNELGIPVVVDLPGVGTGYVDHVSFTLDFLATNNSDIRWAANPFTGLTTTNLYDFFTHGRGPLTRFPVPNTYFHTGLESDGVPDGNAFFLVIMIGK